MKNKKKIVVYHNDPDGYFSAISYALLDLDLISKIKDLCNLDIKEREQEIKEISRYVDNRYDFFYVEHGKDNILQKIEKANFNLDNYNKFILLDFSAHLDVMKYLKNKFNKDFIWIDHHKRIYEEYESKIDIKGIREHNYSACRLAWKYFNKSSPKIIKYIEDVDIWNWNLPYSKEINSFLYLNFNKFDFLQNNLNYLELFNNNIFDKRKNKFIEIGENINKYKESRSKRAVSKGKIIDFHNYKTLIVNTQQKAGDICDIVFDNPYYKEVKIILVWYRIYTKGFDKVSLRSKSDKIDVSKICKKQGGNGHPKAAGFVTKDISKII